MEHTTFAATILHKQRAEELQASARVERFLHDMKKRDAIEWQQRRIHRHRKSRF